MYTNGSSYDPYSNNPYLGDRVFLSIHGGGPVKEGYSSNTFVTLSDSVPYDVRFVVRTDANEYKQANFLYGGSDYKQMNQYFTIPAGETRVDVPIEVFQNEDPYDWAIEYTLVEIDRSTLPPGIELGTGSARITIKDMPTWDFAPIDVYGTTGDDQFVSMAGDQVYYGGKGYDVLNLSGIKMEDVTFMEYPDGRIEIVTEKYGTDVINIDVEGIFLGEDFKFLPREDIFKPVKTSEGTPYDDVLNGTYSLDYILGKGGNDIIIASPGSDQIDGGYGIDIIAYFGESSYSMDFAGSADGIHVSTNSSLYNSDTIKGVEWAAFINGQEIDVVSMASLIA